MTHGPNITEYSLFACLPFVSLVDSHVVHFGPLIFWSASKAEEFLTDEDYSLFISYIQEMSCIKAPSESQDLALVDTLRIKMDQITCISISNEVPLESREFLLLDGLYLLYFTCCFRNFYYGQKVISFHPFRKILPAAIPLIKERKRWEADYIPESDREEWVALHIIDLDICSGLGKALEAIYGVSSKVDKESLKAYKRIVRSIRYLVDHTFPRFIDLLGHGLNFSEEIFEPENIIFIASSFESLFDLVDSQEVAADFKHRLRPLLHLKYTCPVEMFWKWVDDFYEIKRRILKGETFVDPFYRRNPNFEVSHILLGIKLFVYSIYYSLYDFDLLPSKHEDPYTPPDFKWIHPEEVLLFFWTEESVLEKIKLIIHQCLKGGAREEALADLALLTTLFVSLYDRYYLSSQFSKKETGCRFIPTPLDKLLLDGRSITDSLEVLAEKGGDPLLKLIHPYFVSALTDRLEEKTITTFLL